MGLFRTVHFPRTVALWKVAEVVRECLAWWCIWTD
jgi:hypothetical protein